MVGIWCAPVFGIIVGNKGGTGSKKKKKKEYESDDGTYQGLFSLGNIGIGVYAGGIVGAGESFGPYATAGLMIGQQSDI